MAIVQISQITQRKGLQADLPQLAGAEFGWSTDERRLFIGNGTLAEGAPVIGNTEILTEFSDIININTAYTYKGQAAGYTVQTGPTAGDPVTQSLQSWLDQFATVKDFGAVGDGVTDDTDAINRAMQQIYCIQANPQIRRGIFFPAGVYLVSDTINIPPYATLWGEGPDNSIIQLDSTNDSALVAYVARTADSLQQTGVNIGNNGTGLQGYPGSPNSGSGGGGYAGGAGTYASTSPVADGAGGGSSFITSLASSVSTSDGNYDGLNTFSGSSITNLNSYNSGSGYILITKL